MDGSGVVGERAVNSNCPVGVRQPLTRRRSREQGPEPVDSAGPGGRSVAVTVPWRRCTTSIAPGSSFGVGHAERVEDRRQHRAVGAEHRDSSPATSARRPCDAPTSAVAPSSLSPSSSSSFQPVVSAYGADGLDAAGAARADDPGDVVRREHRHQPLRPGRGRPGRSGRSRSSCRHALRERASPWRSTTSGVGLAPQRARLLQGVAVVVVGEPLERLVVRHPARPRRSRRSAGSRSRRRRPTARPTQ